MRIFISFLCGTLFVLGADGAHALAHDYNPGLAGAGKPEVHITRDSIVSIRSARVEQVIGNTFFLQVKWGQLPMRFVMKTDKETKVVKKHGGAATVAVLKLGDYLDADGELIVGSDFFGLNAKQVKDWSLQEESETFSGVITEVNTENFMLETPLKQALLVRPASTTSVKRGTVSIPWGRLLTGDRVLLADGVYSYANNTLTAATVMVFQDKNPFSARNYEGVLRRVESARLPTLLLVSVGGADYTVRISEKTPVLKKNRTTAELVRFVVGDTVRFYGPLLEEPFTLRDERMVEAEIVRNLNL